MQGGKYLSEITKVFGNDKFRNKKNFLIIQFI